MDVASLVSLPITLPEGGGGNATAEEGAAGGPAFAKFLSSSPLSLTQDLAALTGGANRGSDELLLRVIVDRVQETGISAAETDTGGQGLETSRSAQFQQATWIQSRMAPQSGAADEDVGADGRAQDLLSAQTLTTPGTAPKAAPVTHLHFSASSLGQLDTNLTQGKGSSPIRPSNEGATGTLIGPDPKLDNSAQWMQPLSVSPQTQALTGVAAYVSAGIGKESQLDGMALAGSARASDDASPPPDRGPLYQAPQQLPRVQPKSDPTKAAARHQSPHEEEGSGLGEQAGPLIALPEQGKIADLVGGIVPNETANPDAPGNPDGLAGRSKAAKMAASDSVAKPLGGYPSNDQAGAPSESSGKIREYAANSASSGGNEVDRVPNQGIGVEARTGAEAVPVRPVSADSRSGAMPERGSIETAPAAENDVQQSSKAVPGNVTELNDGLSEPLQHAVRHPERAKQGGNEVDRAPNQGIGVEARTGAEAVPVRPVSADSRSGAMPERGSIETAPAAENDVQQSSKAAPGNVTEPIGMPSEPSQLAVVHAEQAKQTAHRHIDAKDASPAPAAAGEPVSVMVSSMPQVARGGDSDPIAASKTAAYDRRADAAPKSVDPEQKDGPAGTSNLVEEVSPELSQPRSNSRSEVTLGPDQGLPNPAMPGGDPGLQARPETVASLDGARPQDRTHKSEAAQQAPDKPAPAGAQYGGTVLPANRPLGRPLAVAIGKSVHDGREHLRISLDPKDLGQLDVRLSIERNGAVRAVVTASSEATAELIRQDLPTLVRSLSDAGLKVDGGSIRLEVQADARGHSQHRQQHEQDRQNRNTAPKENQFVEDELYAIRPFRAGSIIELRA